MAITNAELIPYYAQHRNQADPTANGGRPSNNRIVSGRENNVWPPLTTAQRAAGQIIAEKICVQNRNASGEGASDPMIGCAAPNPSDDINWIVAGTQDDMQSDIASGARRYAAAKLAAAAAAGASSIALTLESAELAGAFASADTVLIHDGSADPTGSTVVREFAVIDSVSASGTALTLTLVAPLANSYPATGVCASMYRPGGDWRPQVSGIQQSGAGTYDFTNHPLVLDNRGTVRRRWTLTYTGATAGELSGDDLGSLGAFDLTADLAPLGPDGYPYFTLAAAGHGDAHAAGDTLIFETSAAVLPVWWFKQTPAGAAAPELVAPALIWFTESA